MYTNAYKEEKLYRTIFFIKAMLTTWFFLFFGFFISEQNCLTCLLSAWFLITKRAKIIFFHVLCFSSCFCVKLLKAIFSSYYLFVKKYALLFISALLISIMKSRTCHYFVVGYIKIHSIRIRFTFVEEILWCKNSKKPIFVRLAAKKENLPKVFGHLPFGSSWEKNNSV